MNKRLQIGFAKLLFILFFIVTVNVTLLNAQPSLRAECPQKTIGKNDYLQVAFKLENAVNVESINPPSFKNFVVLSGPNQESGMTSINGKVDQYVSISYVLKPNSTGNFTIAPAMAKADGKELKSNSLSINVTNSSTSSGLGNNNLSNSFSPFPNLNFDISPEPATHRFDDYILKKGENIDDKVKKNIFIKLEVSKPGCFVGESVTASYKLYSRLRSESTVTDAPSFNGFSVSDIPLNTNNASGVEKYNGRDYNVYVLRKVQLYPLQSGAITLDPIIADNKITFIKSEYAGSQKGDMFLDMMQNFADATSPQDAVIEQHVNLQSKPVEINVKPLPEENKPADFKGAVGNFTIESSLQKDNISTDDAGNLKVAIAGAGNIQLVNAPKINWPEGIDGYDAKITDGIDKSSVPMKGMKTFIYPFTASKKGSYIIPSITFSFFDPATSTYKSLSTNPLTVNVSRGKSFFRRFFVKSTGSENTSGISGFFEKYSLYIIAGIVLLAGFIIMFFKRNTSSTKIALTEPAKEGKQIVPEKIDEHFIIPENILEDAHVKLMEEDSAGFYNVLDISLKKYLSAKLKVPAEELTKKKLNEELDKCNVGLGTSFKLSSLLEDIELNVYAPPSNVNHLKEVYEKASEVISLLDKQVC